MSKIESFRRLTMEDYPDIPPENQEWAQRFFEAVNRAFEDVISLSLQGGLTTSNENAEVFEVSLEHGVPTLLDTSLVKGSIESVIPVDTSGVDFASPLKVRVVALDQVEVTAEFAGGAGTRADVRLKVRGGD